MESSVLDTDIFSEVIKGVDRTVARHAAAYQVERGRLAISVMTITEIVRGYHRMGRQGHIARLLGPLPSLDVLTIDEVSAELAGRIDAELENIGQSIGRVDPLIADIAIRHDRVLVTGNGRHYGRIRSLGYGLRIEDWRQSV